MTVARRFSIRYLWVDSLCIIQDSKEDWERESSTMRHVYANSSCNICATASSNPSEGLFRARQNNIIQPGLMIMKTDSTTNKYYIINNGYWDSQVTRTVLNKRGWVFQERLLAPRILHFARHQLFWECFTENKCEVYPVGIPLHRPLKSFKPIFTEATQKEGALSMDALCLWHRLIKEYTNCALTRSSDRLAALAGLARLFQDATGDEYLYGLWRSRLAESMHWQPLSPMTKHSCEYLSPSWSWASGIGSVTISAPDSHFITVLDARSHSSSFDITGQLLRGFIKIKGPVVRATCVENVRPILVSRRTTSKVYQLRLEVWPPESDDMTHFGSSRQLFIAPPKPSPGLITAALFQDFQSTKFDVGRSMLLLGVCVPLFDKVVEPHLKGLILEHTSSSSDLFVRIGTFEIRGKDRMEEFGVCVNSENKSCWLNEGVKRAVITIV
ncbi:hypothetical protein GJ744_001067 [Endocarpon pusillum]|uniref:Heterokaryon incompatibility domain-containing protein n=1 Tax=Endocarpon pusillum TaxID=364733 RepID=A0A8H7AHK7_9EURO|nr:hypothetical protein GJ744_001067 [Endocarpon pusillum]